MRGVLAHSFRILAVTLLSANFCHGQITPPPQSPTIFSFLGIPQGLQKLKGAVSNRRGNHPKLEPKPKLKALADLANLESPVAAIKKAAEVKAAEDLKPQKIKAIKYLAEIGCGCYDKDGSITDALIAASDDPTPDVRLAVVEEIYKAARGACCSNCGSTCCCNEKMTLRLAEMAYHRDETGCYLEPNAEVRAAAVRALEACCPGTSPVIEETPTPPKPDPYYPGEGPQEEQYQGEGDAAEYDPPPAQPQPPLSRQEARAAPTAQTTPTEQRWDGVLLHVDTERGIAHVHLTNQALMLPKGATLHAYGVVDGQQARVGMLTVYETFLGSANVRAIDEPSRQAIVRGVAVLSRPDPQIVSLYSPRESAVSLPVASAPEPKTPPQATAPRSASTTSSPSRTSLSRLHGSLRRVSTH